jgi:integration host factor subunit alpha
MTLTKANIAEEVWNKTRIPKWRSAELVDSAFEAIKETLESGEDVLISGFGKFSVQKKKERRGRNPQTGEPITLAARKIVTFKCCRALRNKMNGKR